MKCSEKYHVPYVITEHLPYMILADEFGKEGADAWQLPYLKEAYKKASMVIPVSEELVDDIACFIGKDYKWKFISNTIDIDFFAYRKRDSWKGRPFVLCCVADFVVRKGYDVMLATIKDFISKYGVEVKIVIAGNNTDSKRNERTIWGMEASVVYERRTGTENIIDNGAGNVNKILGSLKMYKNENITAKIEEKVLINRQNYNVWFEAAASSTG